MTRRQAERLTDLQIKQTKPHSDKATILPDGKGLRLVVYPNDARYWQLRSERDGKEPTIHLGFHPQPRVLRLHVGLKQRITQGGGNLTHGGSFTLRIGKQWHQLNPARQLARQ